MAPSPNMRLIAAGQSRWQHDDVQGNVQPRQYVVLDTASGVQLWEKALNSDRECLRGCETVQWHPDSQSLLFGVWELRNDQLQTELPSPPPRVCTVTIGDTQPGDWNVWYVAASNQALTQILCSPVSDGEMWVGVLSVDESDTSRLQAVILHWPSGQLHWWDNDLSQPYLWWGGTGQFAYFKQDAAEKHGCRLCVMKLASQLGLDDTACSWTARLSAESDQLSSLLGAWPHSQLMLSAAMSFSPSGRHLALAARYDKPAYEKRRRSVTEQVIIMVDTWHPELPIVAGLDVQQEQFFEILELYWSADSGTVCALCQCYSPLAAMSSTDDSARFRRAEKSMFLFHFQG